MTLVQEKRCRGKLLTEPTSFVGREGELARLAELLHGTADLQGQDRLDLDRPPLVTITGLGGVGKTRLALRAAAGAARWYPGGVRFTDLATVGAPESLPAALMTGLGLSQHGLSQHDLSQHGLSQPGLGAPDEGAELDAVLAHLRDRRLLLVLDTCEHLIDACAGLTASLLRGAMGLSVLATSRQPLDVPGDHIVPLRPLAVPDRGTRDTAGTAVELFRQRAASAAPDCALTDD